MIFYFLESRKEHWKKQYFSTEYSNTNWQPNEMLPSLASHFPLQNTETFRVLDPGSGESTLSKILWKIRRSKKKFIYFYISHYLATLRYFKCSVRSFLQCEDGPRFFTVHGTGRGFLQCIQDSPRFFTVHRTGQGFFHSAQDRPRFFTVHIGQSKVFYSAYDRLRFFYSAQDRPRLI